MGLYKVRGVVVVVAEAQVEWYWCVVESVAGGLRREEEGQSMFLW